MKNIEILNESNKDYIFNIIPTENKENKVIIEIKSLKCNTIWQILERSGNTLKCVVKHSNHSYVSNVHIWDLWNSDCYISNRFII